MRQDMVNCNRLEWIDYSKGILILLVIAGHAIPEFGLQLPYLERIIYSFHMPAFFIISGYLYKQRSGETIYWYIRKKAKQLLLPYCEFCILIFFCHLMKQIVLRNDSAFFVNFLKKEILLGTITLNYKSIFSNLWFLPAMFSASIVFSLIHRKFKYELLRFFACLFLGCVSCVWASILESPLPVNLDAALLALPFMELGYIYKRYSSGKKKYEQLVLITSILIVLGLNMFAISNGIKSDSFYNLHIENWTVFCATSIVGTLLLFNITKRLTKQRCISFLGKNSLSIYGLHFISQNIIGFIPWPTIENVGLQLFELTVIVIVNVLITVSVLLIWKKISNNLRSKTLWC